MGKRAPWTSRNEPKEPTADVICLETFWVISVLTYLDRFMDWTWHRNNCYLGFKVKLSTYALISASANTWSTLKKKSNSTPTRRLEGADLSRPKIMLAWSQTAARRFTLLMKTYSSLTWLEPDTTSIPWGEEAHAYPPRELFENQEDKCNSEPSGLKNKWNNSNMVNISESFSNASTIEINCNNFP